jgi:hypothetical protein
MLLAQVLTHGPVGLDGFLPGVDASSHQSVALLAKFVITIIYVHVQKFVRSAEHSGDEMRVQRLSNAAGTFGPKGTVDIPSTEYQSHCRQLATISVFIFPERSGNEQSHSLISSLQHLSTDFTLHD